MTRSQAAPYSESDSAQLRLVPPVVILHPRRRGVPDQPTPRTARGLPCRQQPPGQPPSVVQHVDLAGLPAPVCTSTRSGSMCGSGQTEDGGVGRTFRPDHRDLHGRGEQVDRAVLAEEAPIRSTTRFFDSTLLDHCAERPARCPTRGDERPRPTVRGRSGDVLGPCRGRPRLPPTGSRRPPRPHRLQPSLHEPPTTVAASRLVPR